MEKNYIELQVRVTFGFKAIIVYILMAIVFLLVCLLFMMTSQRDDIYAVQRSVDTTRQTLDTVKHFFKAHHANQTRLDEVEDDLEADLNDLAEETYETRSKVDSFVHKMHQYKHDYKPKFKPYHK